MAKPNYQFEKRQRDLAKKAKKEEKKQRKVGTAEDGSVETDSAGTDSVVSETTVVSDSAAPVAT